MASVKEVEALNSKIEKINLERTKVKTQQELLQKRLEQELKEYNDSFGVNLLGDNIKVTQAKIKAEIDSVTKVVNEEYALKEKVVKAIEDGDYDYANKLMGITVDEQEEIATQVVEDIINEGINASAQDGTEVLYPSVDEDALAIPEEPEEEEEMDLQAMADSFSMEDDEEVVEEEEDFGLGEDTVSVSANDFLQSVANVTKTDVNAIKGSSIQEASEDLTSGLNIGNLIVEDDEDDMDEDFGFGDMLSGTKFGK